MLVDFARIANEIHQTALDKGWWDRPSSDLEVMALIHSEISEAVEVIRKAGLPIRIVEYYNIPEGWLVELADAVIRILDFVEGKGLTQDFVSALELKMEYNKSRPYRHGGKVV